jgi:hypothetical protein
MQHVMIRVELSACVFEDVEGYDVDVMLPRHKDVVYDGSSVMSHECRGLIVTFSPIVENDVFVEFGQLFQDSASAALGCKCFRALVSDEWDESVWNALVSKVIESCYAMSICIGQNYRREPMCALHFGYVGE